MKNPHVMLSVETFGKLMGTVDRYVTRVATIGCRLNATLRALQFTIDCSLETDLADIGLTII